MGKSIPIPKEMAVPVLAAVLAAPPALSYAMTSYFDAEFVSRDVVTTGMSYIRGDYYRARLDCPDGSRPWAKFRALDREDAIGFIEARHPDCRIERLRLSDFWH